MQAIIYTRFSPRKDADTSESCETQEALCRELAEQKGIEVKNVFNDPDVSGKDEFREKLWFAIDDVKKNDVIIVYKRDRLARNVYLSEQINRSVKKRGGTILAVSGDIEGDGPEHEMIRQILASIAEYERKLIGMRTSHAMKHHQKHGRRMSSNCPYGWKRDPDKPGMMVQEYKETSAIIRIKELVIDGKNNSEITRILNEDMFSYARTGKWNTKTVRLIVKRIAESA